jgi:ligand-binding sensor domain-containing protein/signal transduction histidine kinase
MGLRCVTLGFLLCCAISAQYSRRIWRSEDGLPQNKVQVISQTREGYLWIGTSGGLVRFDGVRFVVFDRSNTPALREDSILALCPARDGSLWIGTEGGGVARMKDGVFSALGISEGLTNRFVRAIAEDRQGRLWVGTDRGFFRFAAGHFLRLDARGDVPILAVRAIYEDRAGNVQVGASRGLFVMRGDQMVRAGAEYSAVGSVEAILETGAGVTWLASGQTLLRVAGGKAEPSRNWDAISLRTFCQDHLGNVWVGTVGKGLVRIGLNGITATYRAPDMLPDNTVLSVFEDREQNLWIGTQDGLLRLTRRVVRTITSRNGLADDNVATVYEDPGGTLWIGTITDQLYRLEGERAVPFRLPREAARFRGRNIYVDREGVEWIGSAGQGVLRIAEGKTRVFTMQDGLRSNAIRQVLEDRAGMIWIATGSGLSRWDGHSIRTFYLEDGLAYGSVRVLAEDRHGDLLVGTDGGLSRVRSGRFVRDPVFAQLGNERIWTILSDAAASLWLGTRGNGLVRIRDGKITRYTTKDGLLSNSIYQILEDRSTGRDKAGHDRFWMSSSAGIFSTDRKELDAVAEGRAGPLAVVPYGTDDGMLSTQLNGGGQGAGCRTRSGEFWFPSVKGAVRIDPEQRRTPPSAPVRIESIEADDRPLPLSGEVLIPPGRGKLEIDYTSPNLLSPDRVTFKYKLESFDDSWTPSPKRRAAYYTNLPPGRYRFRVLARDGAQPEHVSEAILPFVLQPHFYETLWFYGACLVVAGTLIWGVFRFYARQTRTRYSLVLAERTRLAREMHDTVIQGCVGVSTLLEAARSLPPSATGRVRELLDRAAGQIRLTVNEARETVWDLRHSAIEHGLTDTLRDFARQISTAEGIPVRADIQGTPMPLDDTADRNLLLVAREAIRNAVVHAQPRQIDVALCFEPSAVRLEVNDDGCGFTSEPARENVHYGIVGMRERVEQSGGTFELVSSPGHGTRVIARLPLKVRHAGTDNNGRNGAGVDRG